MPQRFSRTFEIIESGIRAGFHPGAQLYISQDGKTLVNQGFGSSRADVPMTSDTLNLWMSSVKPIVAVAVGQLWERNLLNLNDRVAQHIPEFGVKGKQDVTIRHVLTHTGGFRAVIGSEWSDSYEQAVEKVCNTPLEPRWIPGQTAGYHLASGWFVLAEIVRRIDGRRIDQYVREAIFLPLGMDDCWLGIPVSVYEQYGNRIGFMFDTRNGKMQPAELGNSREDAAAIKPGANGRGPINQLARFYETLLRNDPSPLLKRETVIAMTHRQRQGTYDLTFKHVIDFGLGFIINSNQYGAQTVPYGYGELAGANTFGHSGQESSCAFCDPDHKLVAAWVCNGMPGSLPHAIRQRQINTAIYQDLF